MHLLLLQLMHLGCDWKCMSSYKVACRWRPNRPINSSNTNSSSNTANSSSSSKSSSSSSSTSASTAVKSGGAEQSPPAAVSSGSSPSQQQQQQQHSSQDHTVHIVGAVAPVPEENEVSVLFNMFNCLKLLVF
jgi:hypothetical protein